MKSSKVDPMLLQKQLRENASDLGEFCKELKTWGEELKRQTGTKKTSQKSAVNSAKFQSFLNSDVKKAKTEGPTKHVTFSEDSGNSSNHNAKSSKVTDYLAWDKFDADAECEKVDYDENDDSELTDEQDNSKREEAVVEKEKGNKLVKVKKWDEAIKCYSKAIDCYSYDPIFYANRALCFLKTENMVQAESDCTLSLKLDRTYVKAYQRRAAAREALNKLEEAKDDLEKVLELEPNNKESKLAIENIKKKLEEYRQSNVTQRPVSKFTASRKRIVTDVVSQQNVPQSQTLDAVKPQSHWPSGDDVILVKAAKKPPHLRSKAPLKRLEIMEVEDLPIRSSVTEQDTEPVKSHVVEKKEEPSHVPKITPFLKSDDLKIIEKASPPLDEISTTKSKEFKNDANQLNKSNKTQIEETKLVPAKTSVQFYSIWRQLKSQELKYEYLKLLEAENIPDIFKENLDINVFSEIISIISEYFIKNFDQTFPFLWHFSKVKRFSTFTMFMSTNDKNCFWKIIDFIKQQEGRTGEEIENLIKLYEL